MNLREKIQFRLPHLSAIIKPSNFNLDPVLYLSFQFKFDPSSDSVQSLGQLFTQFGSDKSSVHDYHLLYAELINLVPTGGNILEIGIGTNNPNLPSTMGLKGKPGASLRAWKASKQFKIVVGADIDKKCLFKEPGIETFLVDQLSERSLQNLTKKIVLQNIDKPYLIIDDGLHTLEANCKTFRTLYPFLENGGFFVIEDITPENLIPLLMFVAKTISAEKISIFGNPNKGNDNNLLVIEKK